jgi:hypothetical protein
MAARVGRRTQVASEAAQVEAIRERPGSAAGCGRHRKRPRAFHSGMRLFRGQPDTMPAGTTSARPSKRQP